MPPDELLSPPAFPGGGGTERWLPIPGWPYEASSRGRVRSLARGKPLKPQRDRDGYRYVELSDGPRRRRAHIARLVLLAHRGEPPAPSMEALHKNGRRGDCRLANLRWGTKAENRADREKHRKERAARRAARAAGVTGEGERETAEIDGAPSCQLESGTGVSRPW